MLILAGPNSSPRTIQYTQYVCISSYAFLMCTRHQRVSWQMRKGSYIIVTTEVFNTLLLLYTLQGSALRNSFAFYDINAISLLEESHRFLAKKREPFVVSFSLSLPRSFSLNNNADYLFFRYLLEKTRFTIHVLFTYRPLLFFFFLISMRSFIPA